MVTNEILNRLLKEEIKKAKDLDLEISDNICSQVKIDKSRTHYGCCKYLKDLQRGIYISKYFLNAPEEEIRTVIMHEVLHTIKNSKGHDYIWCNAASKVLNAYDYMYGEYHLHSHPYSKDRSNYPHTKLEIGTYKYILKCPKCGQLFQKNKMCKMVKYYDSYYHKVCGKEYKLVRIK